jgi:hypothetical protein
MLILSVWGITKTIQTYRIHQSETQSLKKEIQLLEDTKTKTEAEASKLKKEKEELQKQYEALKLSKASIVKTTYAAPSSVTTEAQAKAWIIAHEGGATSVNKSSLACGAPQSLPCSKILSFAGVDMSKYNLNTYEGVKAAISTVPLATQEAWMDQYVMARYKSYMNAYHFWVQNRWY